MRDTVELSGVVLQAQPVGDYDKRLVVLTKERGKVTVFARGARRTGNPNMALSDPLVFAKFSLYEGRDAYTLRSASVFEYFKELSSKLPEVWYAFYFAEFASFFAREGLPAGDEVDLLYVTFRALLKGKLDPSFVRSVYEIRMLAVSGLYAVPDEGKCSGTVRNAIDGILSLPVTSLYSFGLLAPYDAELAEEAERARREYIDRPLRSEEILEEK